MHHEKKNYPPVFQIFLFRRRANCSNDLWLLIDMECRIITNSVQIRSAGSMTTARYVNVKAFHYENRVNYRVYY